MNKENDEELAARIGQLRNEVASAKNKLRAAERKRTQRMCGGPRVRYYAMNDPRRIEQREFCLRIIDIGYKALATKLHPDMGGSQEEMARLNHVRERLKASA